MINENGTDRDFGIKVETPVGIGEIKTLHVALRINAPPKVRFAVLVELDSQYRAKFEENGIDLAKNDYIFLALSFSPENCGCSVAYKRPQDVPLEDVLCEHGNYFLRWVE